MNNKKYNLSNFFETLKSDANFNTLKERIGNYAKININTKDGKKINIYSAEMVYLLSSEDYKDEGFINAYAKGYHNGNEFIENKTQKALNGFFKSCPEKYIDELKVFYFDKAPNENVGFKEIAKSYPINFYIDSIEKIGFASGVINAIDLMAIENSILFENFYLQIKPPYSENIELYKNSASNFFMENCINKTNEDGTINKLYYSKFLTDSLIAGLNDIDTNEAFTLFKDKAKDYIRTEKSLKTNIIKYLIGCNKDQINVIQYHWYEIEDIFFSIKKDFIGAIEYYKVTNDTLKAIKLKQYIVSKLKLIVWDLESFHIYLTETPIEAKINNLIAEFERSIDINEINQIEALKNTPQQNEIIKNIELYKNCVNPLFLESYNHKINKDQTANNLYYFDRLTDKYTSLINEIETNEAYKNYKNEALEFLVKEKSLILKTIKFLISCSENKNTTNIQLQWHEIEDQIKSIKNTINVIEYFKINNDYVKALELKDFIKYRLNTVISYFESFTIYLNKTPIESLINDLITDFNNCIDVSEISQIKALKTIPQQVESIKPDEVIKEFKDFFIPDVKIETINNIQTNFKDLIGKKMAFLIYLLETEFKIINYSLNGKNDSRKHFVKSLKSIDTKMQGINKHFETNSTNLSIHKFENDNDYKKIKDFLTKTI